MRLPLACLLLSLTFASDLSAQLPAPTVRFVEVLVDDDRYSITVEFAQPMATWGQNQIRSGALVSVDPAVECVWFWEDERRLNCNVSSGKLANATTYRVLLGKGFFTLDGKPFPPQSVSGDSPRPELQLDDVTWADRARPVISLRTDQRIAVEAAIIHLRLRNQAGEIAALEAVSSRSTDQHESGLDVRPRAALTEGEHWKLDVLPGLPSLEGPLKGTQVEELAVLETSRGYRFLSINCGSERFNGANAQTALRAPCSPGSGIDLAFSRPLSDLSIESLKALLPAGAEFDKTWDPEAREVRRPERGFYRISKLAPGSTHSLPLLSSLVSIDGLALENPRPIALRSADAPPHVHPGVPNLLARPGHVMQADFAALNARRAAVRGLWFDDAIVHNFESVLDFASVPTNARTSTTLDPPLQLLEKGGFLHGNVRREGATKHDQTGFQISVAGFALAAWKVGQDVLVFAYDWDTGAPIAVADVALYEFAVATPKSVASFERIAHTTATTDVHGIALIRAPAVGAAQRWDAPGMYLRAEREGKSALVPMIHLELRGERKGDYEYQSNPPRVDAVFGATDKMLYRPGETVAFRLVVRERNLNRLELPQQRTGWKVQVGADDSSKAVVDIAALDDFGIASGEWSIPAAAYDGRYTLNVIAPGEKVDAYPSSSGWGETTSGLTFQVAGFRATDFEVTAKLDKAVYGAGEGISLDVDARYFSGGVLDRGFAELSQLLLPKPFNEIYTDYADYDFADPAKDADDGGREVVEDSSRFDIAEGKGSMSGVVSRPGEHAEGTEDYASGEIRISAIAQSMAGATVTSAPAVAVYAPHDLYLGLRVEDPWLETGKAPELHAIAVGRDGKALSGVPARLSISRNTGSGEPEWKEEAGCEISLPSRDTCAWVAPESGAFRFRLEAAGAMASESLAYAFGYTDQDKDKERLVVLTPPKGPIVPGSDFEIIIRQPFDRATAVVTIEHGGILAAWTQALASKSDKLRFRVDPSWAPGATLGVAVVPAGSSTFPADGRVVFGADSVKLEIAQPAPANLFDVELTKSARPGEKVKIALISRHTAPLMVTVATVDSGVATFVPDLVEALEPWQPQWLGRLKQWTDARYVALAEWGTSPRAPVLVEVEASPEIYPTAPMLASGGDDEQELNTINVVGSRIKRSDIHMEGHARGQLDPALLGRSNRVTGGRLRSDFRDAAPWFSRELAPGARIEHEIVLPDNLTEWRVLAWAADAGQSLQFEQKSLRTELPLEIRLRHPEHAVLGDRAEARAAVRNRTPRTQQVTLEVTPGEGAASERTAQSGRLAANAELAADTSIAIGDVEEINFESRAGAGRARDAVGGTLVVVSPEGTIRTSQTGVINGRAVLPAHPDTSGQSVRLELTRLPFPHLAETYAFFREYPHLCLEQQTSRALAGALAPELAEAGATREPWEERKSVITRAVAEFPLHQSHDGGAHYFPGNWDEGDSFLSGYMGIAITELERRGVKVDAVARERLGEFLKDRLSYYEDPDEPLQPHDLEARAFVMAGATALGLKHEPSPKAFKPVDAGLSSGALAALLRASTGDDSSTKQRATLIAGIEKRSERRDGYRVVLGHSPESMLGSRLRDQCLTLSAMLSADTRPDAAKRSLEWLLGINYLLEGRGHFGDTQASAICLLSLAEYRKKYATVTTSRVTATQGASEIGSWTLDPTNPTASATLAGDASQPIELASSELAGFVAIGERKVDLRVADATATGLAIDRDYAVLRDGTWVNALGKALRHGEMVRVRLRVSTGKFEHFVAITDPLPGGLGSLHPDLANTLGAGTEDAESGSSWWFEHHRYASDATYHYAEQLPPGTHDIVYFARAEHAGSYAALPALVELMYGPAQIGTSAAQRLEIERRDEGIPPAAGP